MTVIEIAIWIAAAEAAAVRPVMIARIYRDMDSVTASEATASISDSDVRKKARHGRLFKPCPEKQGFFLCRVCGGARL